MAARDPDPKLPLTDYHAKRDFQRTPEPKGDAAEPTTPAQTPGRLYVIQKHDATNLHYDLRLELDGTLLSWAIPKGPSLDPAIKRLAVHVEDHPIEYGSFEGVIPKGEYGGGSVMIWDHGEWEPITDPHKGYKKGDFKFRLYGEKLRGEWALVRGRKDSRDWLLLKKQDDEARPIHAYDVLEAQPDSVASGRSIPQIADDADLVWKDGGPQGESKQPLVKPPVRISRLDPSVLTGARKRAQPTTFKPQLATNATHAPDGERWVHEVKFDGYRILALITGGEVTLLSRNGLDWTTKFIPVAHALKRLPLTDAILDGEVCVLDRAGLTDFSMLQQALSRNDRRGFVYYLFDAPHAMGFDLTRTPLVERKAWLGRIIGATPDAGPVLQYSAHIEGNGPIVVSQARGTGVEGIMSKRADAPYEQRRSQSWLKIKFAERDEFIIVGWTDPEGSRSGFGALMLAYHDEDAGGMVWCGKAGTGFNDKSLADIARTLARLTIDTPNVTNPPTGADARGVHWAEPQLVAQVEYTGWTRDGSIRHPTFLALRDDIDPATVTKPDTASGKPSAKTVVRGRGKAVVVKPRSPKDATVAGVRITHPERVVYPEAGLTKLDVAQYYEAVAEWALPFVVKRPLSLVRCPEGLAGQHFYQRSPGEGWPRSIRAVTVGQRKAAESTIVIDDVKGLLSLIQHGVLEIHPWACTIDRPDRPDSLTFDLDPGEGLPWSKTIEAARIVREFLDHLGLEGLLKTTGGKGLHIVVPIERRTDWDEAKEFSRAFAQRLAKTASHLFIATATKSRRKGKVFVDYLRNAPGATSVAAYSTRARPGGPVSTPIRWDELRPALDPARFTIQTVPQRLTRLKDDPWADPPRQRLSSAVRKLDSL